jgi:hypothetical protein
MSDFDVFDDSDHLPPDHLLNELESIKGILDDQQTPAPGDIPLLDDMVIDNLDANNKLLNLQRIFAEDDLDEADPLPDRPLPSAVQMPHFNLNTMQPPDPAEATTPAPIAAPAAARVRPDYSREVLIQELVDEFIPEIEAALHERLSKLDDATLKRWKKPE